MGMRQRPSHDIPTLFDNLCKNAQWYSFARLKAMRHLKAAHIEVFTRITDAREKVKKFKDSPSSWLLEEGIEDVLCRVKDGEDDAKL
jgi:hypothetical protein